MTLQAWVVLAVFALTQITLGVAAYIRVLGRLTVIETLLRNGLTSDVRHLQDEVASLNQWRQGHQAVADMKIKEYDRLKDRQGDL